MMPQPGTMGPYGQAPYPAHMAPQQQQMRQPYPPPPPAGYAYGGQQQDPYA